MGKSHKEIYVITFVKITAFLLHFVANVKFQNALYE